MGLVLVSLTGALEVTLDLELFLSLDLDTVVHALVVVALVLARLVVVGVVAVAVLPDVLAGTLLLLHLCLCVCVDELHHVDNILGDTVTARAATLVLGTEGELDEVLCVEDAFLSSTVLTADLDQGRTRLVLDVVVVHEASIGLGGLLVLVVLSVVLLVLLELTGT